MTSVSVVIPLYNDAAHLAEALGSVFGQTRAPDQVIVVDDGSTDDSYAIASGFVPRITLLRQENQGISGARNTGILAASGEIIALLDADDVWPSDSLETRLAQLDANPGLDAVYGQVEQFLSPEIDAETASRLHCPQGRTAARFAGAMLVRRGLFERAGLFDPALKVGEMVDWTLRADDAGASMGVIDTLVMRRRIHGGNTVIAERASRDDYFKALRASLARKAALQGSAGTPS